MHDNARIFPIEGDKSSKPFTMKPFCLVACLAGIAAASLLASATLKADTNPVFVSFNYNTNSSNAPAIIGIAPPGAGWGYSAAAQVAGTNWNQFPLPNPGVPSGSSNGAVVGSTTVCSSASNVALVNPSGSLTGVRLTASVYVGVLDSTTNRTEPRSGSMPVAVSPLDPAGLMTSCWRLYKNGNRLNYTLSGLSTNASYLLFIYASIVDPSGGKFVLASSNTPSGLAAYLDVPGGRTNQIFSYDGTNYSLLGPATAGVANTTGKSNAVSSPNWGVLQTVSDSSGNLNFYQTNAPLAGGSYINGLQLIPYPLPVISSQPVSSPSATVGSAASISITATNWYTNNFTYQWQKGGTNITNGATGIGSTRSGVSTAVLTISNAQTGDAGNYTCVVSNTGGAVTSSISALGITESLIAPSIASQPANVTVGVGTSTNLSVSANGSAPLIYQWQVSTDGGIAYNNLSGATTATLSFASPSLNDSGTYHVIVTNGAGTVTSDPATLTVTEIAIGTQPVGGLYTSGSSQTLSVTATANPAPGYQWQRSVDGYNFTNIAGGTGSSLPVTFVDTNSGFYRVIATNSVGSVTSTVVMAGVPSSNLGTPTLLPTNNATSVNRDTPLQLTFSGQPVVGSSGTIRVYDATNDTLVASYDLGNMAIAPGTTTGGTNYGIFHYINKTINGDLISYTPVISLGAQPSPNRLPSLPASYNSNTALIYLPSSTSLSYNKSYYVLMDAGVFVDTNGAAFSGITNKTFWTFSTKVSGPAGGATNITVGNDGTATDFSTVQGAADFIPVNNLSPTTVTLRGGLYTEAVRWKSPNVTITGQGRTNTVIAWINNNNINPSTSTRPVMNVVATNVTLQDLTVYNLTPYGGSQAESLYTYGNSITLNRVGLYSYQDTLLANNGSLFVTDSYIEGATDYIWGYAASYFQRCELKANANSAYYTQARNSQASRGFSFVNCTLDADPDVTNSSATLSRTFGTASPFSQTAYVNCRMGPQIQPVGWKINDTTNANATVQLWEYQSRDLSNNLLDVSQRATYNRSFSVSGNTILYTPGQTNSPDVLTNNQISASLAALMTNWINQLGGWVPPAAKADPVITPNLGSTVYVYQNANYVDSGATLIDPVDGIISIPGTGTVNTAVLGSCTVSYSGYTNALRIPYAPVTRTVQIVTAPPVTLNGGTNTNANWGGTFTDPGATVNDPMDGTVTVYGKENGAGLDATKLGSHTLTYSYTNSAGSVTAPVQRTVFVDAVVPALPSFGSNSYNVTVPNAVINGGTPASTNSATNVNATAINAYISYCSTNGGGTVVVPAGTFNTGLITLKSNVNLQLAPNAVLKAASYNTQLISGSSLTNVAITGTGTLNGGATTVIGNANLIVLTSCTKLLVQGVTIKNSGHEHLVIQYGKDVTVDGVNLNDNDTLAANGGNYLSNTDGIDYYGTNFLFKNITLSVGDDNIVAKPLGSACANITITNCTATAGHGYGIGGGMRYGVTNFLVTDSALNGTDYGLRIKAQDNPDDNQGGVVSNVVYRNITMSNVPRPLILESYYDGSDNYPASPADTSAYTTNFTTFTTNGYTYYNTYYSAFRRTNTPYTPTFKNISYINIAITNAVYPGDFEGMYMTQPNIDGLTFSNVTIQSTSSQPFKLWHATNVTAVNLKVSLPSGNAYNNATPIKGVYTNDLGNFTVISNAVIPATITTANTNQTYDGTAKSVTITTTPFGASPLWITYNASIMPPTNAGSYTVVSTVTNAGYSGSSTATLTISKATSPITFTATNLPYNGDPRPVSVSTVPAGLGVTITYAGSTNPPSDIGIYALTALVNDANYQGSNSGTLTIYDAVGLWRQSYFGTANNSGNAADGFDANGNGLSNLEDYTLGNDPNRPTVNAPLTVTSANGNFTVQFLAKAAGQDSGYAGLTRYYALEGCTNLTNSSWSAVPGYTSVVASNQTVTYSTNTSANPSLFFRVRAWLK